MIDCRDVLMAGDLAQTVRQFAAMMGWQQQLETTYTQIRAAWTCHPGIENAKNVAQQRLAKVVEDQIKPSRS